LPEIRRGGKSDLAAIAAIQSAAPEASQWPVNDYLAYDFQVAVEGGEVVAFLVARSVAPGESELLNLAVHPSHRRRGLGRALLEPWLEAHPGDLFLEVRASNSGAKTFYQVIGFKEVGIRNNYYDTPHEAAIVLKFHSC
jgi:[ribosomal protein S18]-alanine N-acetyltransferase